MAELPVIQSFQGDSWDECSIFIQNIRNASFRQGKIRDPAWTADFASIHLMGKALAWYTRLSRDVQEDWSKLQIALVDRWSTPEGEFRCAQCARSPSTGPQDAPAPAAAPTFRSDEKTSYLACGVLKAAMKGSNTTYYVQRAQDDGDFNLTEDVQRAFRFRFDSQSSSKLLECVNDRWSSWLAIHWRQSSPNVGRGSEGYGDLSTVDSETMKSSRGNSGPFQVAMFRVLSSGEVAPIWRNGRTETNMTVFTNGAGLFPVPDPVAYGKKYPDEKQLTLFIQKSSDET